MLLLTLARNRSPSLNGWPDEAASINLSGVLAFDFASQGPKLEISDSGIETHQGSQHSPNGLLIRDVRRPFLPRELRSRRSAPSYIR